MPGIKGFLYAPVKEIMTTMHHLLFLLRYMAQLLLLSADFLVKINTDVISLI
jgi:hypothetical protein